MKRFIEEAKLEEDLLNLINKIKGEQTTWFIWRSSNETSVYLTRDFLLRMEYL